MLGTQTWEMTVGRHRVLVTVRGNATRLNLRLDEKRNTFACSAPRGVPVDRISRFLEEHIDWMDKLAAMKLTEWAPVYARGERHRLRGEYVTLGENGIATGRAFLTQRQRMLEDLIRELLPVWQARMGVRASRVRFRNMHSRWGSCQPASGEIHLSSVLGLVPRDCVEYVLVHELCHLLYPDHGPLFHAAMTRFLPGWEASRKLLSAFDRRPLPPAEI